MISAEAYAEIAQARARVLIEALHLVRNFCAIKHAERLDYLKRKPARDAGQAFRALKLEQRAELFLNIAVDPCLQPRFGLFTVGTGERVVGENAGTRRKKFFAREQTADRFAEPAQRSI